MEWENGEITEEPLNITAVDAPVACAIHGKKKNSLNQPGWKQFKMTAKQQGKVFREAKKTKLHSHCCKPRFKHGIETPRDCDHAMVLDEVCQDRNP